MNVLDNVMIGLVCVLKCFVVEVCEEVLVLLDCVGLCDWVDVNLENLFGG